MKEYYDKVIEFGNLYKGMKKACRNVRWKDSVTGYENNGLKNTWQLEQELQSGRYEISKYQTFKIHEPKERTIVATRIKDRQFQRSLCDNGLYDDICEHFIRDNAACQKGKGTDDAINRLKVHMQRFYRKHRVDGWVLRGDVHHFFPETSHKVAKVAVMKYVSDPRAVEAVFKIIDSFEGEKGIGLGSQVSQLIQLLVLNDLDHFIKERLKIKGYVRYMDDFILIHEDKEHLRECRVLIEQELNKLGLTLNEKTSLFPLRQGISFLKWRFVFTDTGKLLMLADRKKVTNEKRRIRKLIAKERDGEIPEGTAKNSLDCWLANMEKGNTKKMRSDLINYYTERIKNERRISSEETR